MSCSPPAGTRSPSCRTFQGLPVSAVKAARSTRRPTRIRSATAGSGSSWRAARSARSKSPAISRCSGPLACSRRIESNATSCRSCAPGCRPITPPSLDSAGSPPSIFRSTRWQRAFKAFVLRIAGNPEQFGAPRPADNILEAGVSLCQHYLPLVAEGRITIKPWMAGVSGQRVTFADGTEEEVDALICGTGYVFDWDLLDDELSRPPRCGRGARRYAQVHVSSGPPRPRVRRSLPSGRTDPSRAGATGAMGRLRLEWSAGDAVGE